ncbi:MAG TPA: beta-propeller fold lactonase family protein [Micrococcaceae bacterium]|nr:beta-propeller fold lactonase family protein [Micrococcaceae bacterium]
MQQKLYVGSYTEPGYMQPGTVPGAGVSVLGVDDDGRLTSVLASSNAGQGSDGGGGEGSEGPVGGGLVRNPSFLAVKGGVIYAVEELSEGSVVSLAAADLSVRSRTPTGGSDPCDVLVHDHVLLAANYTSGNVALVPFAGNRLESLVQLAAHPGSGPVPKRQESSHAHQTKPTPWKTVLVADLGADRVDEYAVEGEGIDARLTLRASAQLPPGTGPRHMAMKGRDLVVVGELDGYLHHFRHEGGNWERIGAVPVVDKSNNALSLANGIQPSHIQLSADGARLFVAVRGRNSISVLDVSGLGGDPGAGGDAMRQSPALLAEIACGGEWPRHFSMVENPQAAGHGRLYVANLRSNRVSVFALGSDGLPAPEPVQQFDINSPTCVIPGA